MPAKLRRRSSCDPVSNDRVDIELARRVREFPRWHYRIDLGGGVVTPIFDRSHVNRHEQRARYFFEPLVRLCGGSLTGRRVLDLGCNAGYWALKALDAGADFVLGVDGRQMHVDQANLVMEAKGVASDRYSFECTDALTRRSTETFDIVLCLGLLYHVAKPVELLERCSQWNTDILVIDTSLSRLRGSAFELSTEAIDEPRNSLVSPVVMIPTPAAVLGLLHHLGYEAVTLRPRFSSWDGCRDFQSAKRRAFLSSKATSLHGLDADTESLLHWSAVRTWDRAREWTHDRRMR